MTHLKPYRRTKITVVTVNVLNSIKGFYLKILSINNYIQIILAKGKFLMEIINIHLFMNKILIIIVNMYILIGM